MAVDSAHIYWTNSGPNGNGIGRASLDGSGVNQRFISTAVPATGVAGRRRPRLLEQQRSQHDRAGQPGRHRRQPDLHHGRTESARCGGRQRPPLLGERQLRHDRTGNLDGLEANEFFIFAGSPQAVAVDGAHVWWSNGRPFYAIGQANLDGTSVNQRFFSTLSAPSGVAVDALAAPAPGPGPGPPTIRRLVADVQGLGLPRGIERGLLAKLDAAQRNVDAGDLDAACGSLGAYSNHVHAQSDHTLAGDQAVELIAEAAAIRELLGCSAG